MLKRPPQHRVDARISYVHPKDEAWDNDRIERERAAMKERGEDPDLHPVTRYQGGWTRYDIDAQATIEGQVVSPRDYLDETKHPTIWRLRRLDVAPWYDVHPLWVKAVSAGERPYAAFLKAIEVGIESVEQGPVLKLPGGRLSVEDFRTLHELGQVSKIDLIYDLGQAVYDASMPLTESEGKP